MIKIQRDVDMDYEKIREELFREFEKGIAESMAEVRRMDRVTRRKRFRKNSYGCRNVKS